MKTQAPLFAETCIVCNYATPGEHEPWCAQFMRGEADDNGGQLELGEEADTAGDGATSQCDPPSPAFSPSSTDEAGPPALSPPAGARCESGMGGERSSSTYSLTNLSANIRRNEKRLEALRKEAV